jgi:hypothetical protein
MHHKFRGQEYRDASAVVAAMPGAPEDQRKLSDPP